MLDETKPKNGSHRLDEALKIIVTGLVRRKNRIAINSSHASCKFQIAATSTSGKYNKFSTKDLPSASNKACMSTPECRKHETENIQ